VKITLKPTAPARGVKPPRASTRAREDLNVNAGLRKRLGERSLTVVPQNRLFKVVTLTTISTPCKTQTGSPRQDFSLDAVGKAGIFFIATQVFKRKDGNARAATCYR
jgi:hypothetical protein